MFPSSSCLYWMTYLKVSKIHEHAPRWSFCLPRWRSCRSGCYGAIFQPPSVRQFLTIDTLLHILSVEVLQKPQYKRLIVGQVENEKPIVKFPQPGDLSEGVWGCDSKCFLNYTLISSIWWTKLAFKRLPFALLQWCKLPTKLITFFNAV